MGTADDAHGIECLCKAALVILYIMVRVCDWLCCRVVYVYTRNAFCRVRINFDSLLAASRYFYLDLSDYSEALVADPVGAQHLPAFTIRSTVVIQYGSATWVPEVQSVNDSDFISLNKWDRSFVHFSTGHALDFRAHAKKSANTEFFDRLLRAQRKASADAVASVLRDAEDPLEDEGEPRRKRKRQQVFSMKVLQDSELLGPATVNINIDGHSMTVLCKLRSKSLWVELTNANMTFIRNGTQQSIDKAGRSWHPKAPAPGQLDEHAGGSGTETELVSGDGGS
jgi:hypothetical protein